MSKNPYINALSALAYIVFVVLLMNFITKPLANKPDTDLAPIFAPIVMLSVLTLSVAVMAYIFFYQPALLFLDGKKKDATNLFFRTVGTFALFTSILLLSLRFVL